MFRSFVLALAVLAAAPLLAQQTGPEGLAEPKPLPRKVLQQVEEQAKAAVEAATPARTDANTLNLALSSGGTVSIQLRPDKAPLAVERLKTLAAQHFYDGLVFHRVIEGFMAQGGDPKGTGEGGSTLPDLKAEFSDLPHVRGVLAMARAAGEDSANSQFYIVLSPSLTLDTHYTVVGRVFQGMAYADRLERGEPPANPSRVLRAYVGAPPADSALAPQETSALVAALPADRRPRAAPASLPSLADAPTLATDPAVASAAKPAARPVARPAPRPAPKPTRG